MAGGSARPGRRRAAGPALRYEHRRDGRSSAPRSGTRRRDRVFGCLMFPAFLALILPLVLVDMRWGHEVWGDLAPAWPGGTYAFGATLGALLPLLLAALVAPLTRMKWRASRLRSLAWAVAALPALAAGWLVLGVIGATWRPKEHQDWDGDCHREGGACWVHERFPYLWAVGLAAAVAVTAVLVALLVRRVTRGKTVPEPAT
ncbi:hypothetical protein ACGH7X_22425 [Streptomyces sp. BBFR51]|uniref:hypothetical protein n=1 Tax=Streptomyces sp. BBFR51 TaxID=3372856 RepID=UPI0037DC4131